jgi:phosphoribosylglycinamide formyltransferase-1
MNTRLNPGENAQALRAPVPIAVLASGRGSNFDAIARAIGRGELAAEVRLVLSDRADAPVLEKARALGLRAEVEACEAGPKETRLLRRAAHETRMNERIQASGARFLVLAGYMRVLSEEMIRAWDSGRGYSRIVNVHPSLLPAFPGVGSYAQAYQYGARLAGVTVHLVDSGVDQGPICAQESFDISGCRSEGEVEALGLAVEHRLYPAALAWILPEKFELENRPVASGQSAVSAVRRPCVRPH